jgi:hypothetical protein
MFKASAPRLFGGYQDSGILVGVTLVVCSPVTLVLNRFQRLIFA